MTQRPPCPHRPQRFFQPRLASRLFAALALAAATLAFEAHAARLAMVVGNDNYLNVTKLRNAKNDALSLAKELEAAGFTVTRVLDANREQLDDAFSGFLRRVEKGDEVVFFFSGHGSQPPQLGPFLLPVDIKVTDERAIQRNGLSLESVVDDLNKRARFSLVIVDACRDDPFRETSAGRSLPAGSGLSRIDPPKGTMIIMAASKGQQALDRLGNADPVPNGLFTRELIKQMRTNGQSASEMLKKVRNSVETTAATVNHAQRPSLVDESSSDFFFYPTGASAAALPAAVPTVMPAATPAPTPTVTPPVAPAAAPTVVAAVAPPATRDAQSEYDAWEAATKAGTRAAYETFVAQWPAGRYTPQARTKLVALGAPAPAAQGPAPNRTQLEFDAWDRAATSHRKADYEAYLAQYPDGRYAARARAALKSLQ